MRDISIDGYDKRSDTTQRRLKNRPELRKGWWSSHPLSLGKGYLFLTDNTPHVCWTDRTHLEDNTRQSIETRILINKLDNTITIQLSAEDESSGIVPTFTEKGIVVKRILATAPRDIQERIQVNDILRCIEGQFKNGHTFIDCNAYINKGDGDESFKVLMRTRPLTLTFIVGAQAPMIG